ncbi:hypothetical protein HBI79_087560 [Parastagonospora nodorum]|nr:hypothetical protein HBI79_087560 [Parastagonospora nodorum]
MKDLFPSQSKRLHVLVKVVINGLGVPILKVNMSKEISTSVVEKGCVMRSSTESSFALGYQILRGLGRRKGEATLICGEGDCKARPFKRHGTLFPLMKQDSVHGCHLTDRWMYFGG